MFRSVSVFVLMAAAASVNSAAMAQEKAVTVSEALEILSQRVADFCQSGKESVGTLRVQTFDMPERFMNPNAGKKIGVMLADSISKKEINVATKQLQKCTHVIKGTCMIDKSDTRPKLSLTVSLFKEDGTEIVGFRKSAVEVSDREEVSLNLGLTTDVTTGVAQASASTVKDEEAREQDKKTQAENFNKSVDQPAVSVSSSAEKAPLTPPATTTATVATTTTAATTSSTAPPAPPTNPQPVAKKTIVAPNDDSKFKIEILVKDATGQYQPIPASQVNGFAVVGLNPGDVYAVRVYNDFEFDLGVKLSMDGINSFSLSTIPHYKKSGAWIIPRKSFGTVRGWHVSNIDLKEFIVTTYPESVAKQLGGDAEGIGIIQAQFFAAWSSNEPQPAVELAQKGPNDKLATGAGLTVKSQSQDVTCNIGKTLIGSIAIRYELPELPKDLPTDLAPK